MQFTSVPSEESANQSCFLELKNIEQCKQLFAEDLAIIFKHSPTCDLSALAYSEVQSFCAAQPQIPIHLVSVLESRPVSRFIAAETGVRHESPQIIVLRSGKVVGSASHRRVTEDFIQSFIQV